MQKFMVVYLAPAAMMAEWMKKPEAERKDEEAKMMTEWKAWTAAHAGMIKETNATGKTMRVTKDSAMPASNDMMLYSIVEGESAEAVADALKGHPHFGIPEATIDVMPIRPM